MRQNNYNDCEWCTDRRGNVLASATLIMMGAVIGMVTLAGIRSCDPQPVHRTGELDCQRCHSRKVAMVEYFRSAGSTNPDRMADAVLATKSPRLMAAIAKVETGGNPHVRRGGYKGRHAGAWQVNPKHWGAVPHDPVDQALQAEVILQELTGTMPLKRALSVYGGDSSSRYQRTVLAELVRVP